MAWSDAAREASIAARKANGQANGVAHQNGVGQVGQSNVSDAAINVARNAKGGFSVRPDGTVPTKGYMVAVAGRTREVAGDAMRADTKSILEDYARRNADLLRAPNAHIGGWTDPATGRTHLDVSNNIPRHRDAVRAGKAQNQIGIHDVKRNKFINTGGKGDLK